MEEWRKIPGLKTIYEASSCGQIRRLESTYERMMLGKIISQRLPAIILKQGLHWKGYLDVRVEYKLHRVHRLIARAFIPNPGNLPQVNHKNGIKTDNRPENLEWCTNRQNRDHMVSLGLQARGSRMNKGKLCEDDIPEIRRLLKEKVSQSKIALKFSVSRGCIEQIAQGHNWQHIP